VISSLVGRQTVGRFEIRDFLGRGASGDVMLAWDPRDERLVALKIIRTSKCDPEMLEAEKNGLSLQAKLAVVAPQVAAVFDAGQDGDFYWVAMEYVDGADLSEVLNRGPLPEARAVAIAVELAAMLVACESFAAEAGGRRILGIVHGDIKPENIRLQQTAAGAAAPEGVAAVERVRVLDFGIAKNLTQTRRFTVNLFGTLPYTPPERLERGVVDRHSDLWAVGVVLGACVLGRRPFAGATTEELESAIRHGIEHLPLPAGCSPGLNHVVDRSLAFAVADRYQTAAELKEDLLALRDGRPLPSLAALPAVSALGEAAVAGLATGVDPHATRRTTRPLSGPVGIAEATRRTDRPAGQDATLASGAISLGGAAAAAAGGVASGLGAAGIAAGAGGAAVADGLGPAVPGAPAVPAVPGSGAPGAPLPPAGPFNPVVPAPAAAAGRAGRAARVRRWSLRALGVILALALLAAGGVQVWAWSQANQLRRGRGDPPPHGGAVAQRYSRVAGWSWLSPDLFGVGDDLKKSLGDAAERILDSYHGDQPTTTPRGWQTAYDELHAAAQIDPRDRKLRARMLYAHAHLDRVQSIRLRGQPGQRVAAEQRRQAADLSRTAAAEFQEAARWDPEWPDPYLGLARVYAYDQFDLHALQQTLGELGRRGYRVGRRETAMLADAFRMQGLQVQARAQHARGSGGESDLLHEAHDDLQQAVRFYGDIEGFGGAAANQDDAAEHLREIEARQAELARRQPLSFLQRLGRALSREFTNKPGGG
jgi:tRNA A-37 threonylcarbamoyl transferase component Bud32